MVTWNNLDTLAAFSKLIQLKVLQVSIFSSYLI